MTEDLRNGPLEHRTYAELVQICRSYDPDYQPSHRNTVTKSWIEVLNDAVYLTGK